MLPLDTIRCADLFDLCATLPDKSIDMILCDLPYGTTACSWDTVIPFEPMWAAFRRVIKQRGAIVLTASQPFTSALVMSNPKMFRYEWVWEKTVVGMFVHAKNRPLKKHEDVLVFSSGVVNHDTVSNNRMTYYPQIENNGKPYSKKYRADRRSNDTNFGWRPSHVDYKVSDVVTRYPETILYFPNPNSGVVHPTQKPVALFEYLIRTYTQSGDVVLDPCVGSGTTAVAARKTERRYICGDSSPDYVAVAQQRLQNTDPYLPKLLPNGAKQMSLFEAVS